MHLDMIHDKQIAIMQLIQYYLNNLPVIFVQVTPVAALLTTLYTFARLNRDNELIAMRSSGLNIYQITRTIILFGILTGIVIFWVNDKVVPRSMVTISKIKDLMEKGTQKEKEREYEIIKNLTLYGMKNRLFFINKFTPATNTMEKITILEHDEKQNITKKIVANRGEYKDGLWRFYGSTTYTFDENGQLKQDPQYMEEEIMIITETPQDFLSQRQRPEFMTIAQLDNYIWKLSKSGATGVIRNLKVDLYQKFSSPLTTPIIILLAIPFAMRVKRRSAGLSSVVISLMLGFLYFVINAISVALGKAGILIPLMAASLSHILALYTTYYLLKKLP